MDVHKEIDTRGLNCPLPILKAKKALSDMASGQLLKVVATGQVKLSPELVDYRLYDLPDLKCWPAGTGYALADWLRTRGHEPVFFTVEENAERRRGLDEQAPAATPPKD